VPISGQTTFPIFGHSLAPVVDESHSAVVSGPAAPSSGTYSANAVFGAALPTVFRKWITDMGPLSGVTLASGDPAPDAGLYVTNAALSGIAQVQRELAMRVVYMEECERGGRYPQEDGSYLADAVNTLLGADEIKGY
jgi:hypothetical protein